jgi:hypothetical protein
MRVAQIDGKTINGQLEQVQDSPNLKGKIEGLR